MSDPETKKIRYENIKKADPANRKGKKAMLSINWNQKLKERIIIEYGGIENYAKHLKTTGKDTDFLLASFREHEKKDLGTVPFSAINKVVIEFEKPSDDTPTEPDGAA